MSLNNTFRSVTSIITIAVMLWNILGWLGFGLILNHSHQEPEKDNCEVTFCYCEVEEGENICTCHHNDMNSHGEHSEDSTESNDFCYFTASHSDAGTASQTLIVISKFNAFCLNYESLSIPTDTHQFQAEPAAHLVPGINHDLLRPPRV